MTYPYYRESVGHISQSTIRKYIEDRKTVPFSFSSVFRRESMSKYFHCNGSTGLCVGQGVMMIEEVVPAGCGHGL